MISEEKVARAVSNLCLSSERSIVSDALQELKRSLKKETAGPGKLYLEQIIANNQIAKQKLLPVCQDTGVSIFFVTSGEKTGLSDTEIAGAIKKGVKDAWRKGYFRPSIVLNPLRRSNTGDNTPPVIHFEPPRKKSGTLKISFLAQGAGCENMSWVEMLEPGIGEEELAQYISKKVIMRAFNACPPIVIGIGLGGTIEVAAYLAKRALLKKAGEYSRDVHIARLERKILRQINQSGIGPGGLGGKTTGIGVHVDTAPSHIASLAVAVNLQCWAVRRGTVVIRNE